MRTLNRPMFNMGGPIKEGVMHGIREPYKGGGRTLAGGHQIGTPMGNRTGFALDPRKNILKKAAGWGVSKIPGMTKGWAQKLWNKYKFPSRMQATTPTGPGITHATKARDFMHRAGQYFKKHPYLSTLGPGYLATTDPAAGIAKGVAGAIPPTTQFITEALTPGRFEKYLPPDDWWKWKSDVEWKPGDIRGEDKEVKVPPVAGVRDYGPYTKGPAILTESMREKTAQAGKDRRVNELLEIMGHDKSKKDAVYDALIDASGIVAAAPGGETMDITKDIIQPAIAATSKRFDKPKEIEEAVRLMTVKGEIEKDIAKGKGGALAQNARDMVAAGVFKTEKAALEHLAKTQSITEKSLTFATALKKGYVDQETVIATMLDEYGSRPSVLKSEDEMEKLQKADGYKSDLVEFEFIKEDKNLGPGSYVIGASGFVIDSTGKVKQVLG